MVSSRGICQKAVRKVFTCELLVCFFAPFMLLVEEEIEKALKVVPEARRDLSCSYSKADPKKRDGLGRDMQHVMTLVEKPVKKS